MHPCALLFQGRNAVSKFRDDRKYPEACRTHCRIDQHHCKDHGSGLAAEGKKSINKAAPLIWSQLTKPAVCFTDTCFLYSDLTTSEEICQYSVTKVKSGRPSKPAVYPFSMLLFPDFSPALSVDFIWHGSQTMLVLYYAMNCMHL